MKVLIVAARVVGAFLVYGFVSIASSMSAANDRMNAQVNTAMGGVY
jgi:hypothetical protein